MSAIIRKIVTVVEETHLEMGQKVAPPTRGNGLPLSVTATATMISLARGASLICTSMPSK